MKDYPDLEAKLNDPFSILGDSERFRSFLRVLARFPELSEKNVQLITHQRPDAVMLATFNTWKDLGAPVRTGQSAIQIRNMRGDSWMPAFDISQTRARPAMPEIVSDVELILASAVLMGDTRPEGLDWTPEAYTDAYIGGQLEGLQEKRSPDMMETVRECMNTVVNIRYLRDDQQGYHYMPGWAAQFSKDEQRQLLTTVYRSGKRIIRNMEQSLSEAKNLPERHCGYLKSAEVVKQPRGWERN